MNLFTFYRYPRPGSCKTSRTKHLCYNRAPYQAVLPGPLGFSEEWRLKQMRHIVEASKSYKMDLIQVVALRHLKKRKCL